MNHSEASYIRAGFRFERGLILISTLRAMIESEREENKEEARRLIRRGVQEARS
jgi:hypothetical protein